MPAIDSSAPGEHRTRVTGSSTSHRATMGLPISGQPQFIGICVTTSASLSFRGSRAPEESRRAVRDTPRQLSVAGCPQLQMQRRLAGKGISKIASPHGPRLAATNHEAVIARSTVPRSGEVRRSNLGDAGAASAALWYVRFQDCFAPWTGARNDTIPVIPRGAKPPRTLGMRRRKGCRSRRGVPTLWPISPRQRLAAAL